MRRAREVDGERPDSGRRAGPPQPFEFAAEPLDFFFIADPEGVFGLLKLGLGLVERGLG